MRSSLVFKKVNMSFFFHLKYSSFYFQTSLTLIFLNTSQVELAKYEEQERKQQTHMEEETQDLEDRQTLGENAVLSSHNKAEKSLEHEEKLKVSYIMSFGVMTYLNV